MEFSKLSSPSLKDLFIKEIENLILSGQLSIGDRLPSERELADRMGVSRIVINSGLTELANAGFIEQKPRVGAYVADYRRTGTVDTLLSILRYNGGVLNKKEMKSLLEIRLAFEVLAIELAATELSEEDSCVLEKLLFQFGNSVGHREAAENIFQFHHEICMISGNVMLPLIFYSFKELSVMLWERYFRLYGVEKLFDNTAELYRHLKDHNTAEAIETFKASLEPTISGEISIYYE